MSDYTREEKVEIHAVLMLLAWGFFIPLSSFLNSHTYSRSWEIHTFGVHFHMIVSMIGIVLALASFGFAVKEFDVLDKRGQGERTNGYEYAHAVIGTIVTALAILQPFWMLCMRKPENEEEARHFKDWPLWRKIGHVGHRVTGFLALYLAFICMETGTHLYLGRDSNDDTNVPKQKYSGAFLGTITATIVCVALIMRFEIHRVQPTTSNSSTTASDEEKQQQKDEEEITTA